MLDIEILRNADCHSWKALRDALKDWLRMWGLNSSVNPKITLIETDEEAVERRFFGSPQLLINGKDVDPSAERVTAYHAAGCRLYAWNGKIYEYPPKEMVERAILNLEGTCGPPRKEKSK
jgi:hypothetical protein